MDQASDLAPKLPPGWQAERSRILQRTCQAIKAAVASGQKISRAIYLQSRRRNSKPFKCDAAKRLRLRPGTLRQLWDKWKKAGESPSAFDLKSSPQSTPITAAVLIQFVLFCAERPSKSMRAAWLNFSVIPGSAAGESALPSYDVLTRQFSKLHFHQLQKLLAATHTAQADLEIFKQQIIDGLRQRFGGHKC